MNNDLLDVLSRQGVLLNVSVRYWRAAKKLKAEDQLTVKSDGLGHSHHPPLSADLRRNSSLA